MSELSADQLAQRIYDCGLLQTKELEEALSAAGGRGRATFNDFLMKLLETEQLTNWQISRIVEGHRRGYFYGNWKVLYLIGAGTFARVYRAAHRKTGDIKAVKVLRQRYSGDFDTREQFMREARLVMKLRHPTIVPIYEVEEEKGRIYMVMDFVEGQNLREYVKAHGKIPILTALKIIRDLASGLLYAAEANVSHRDMKLSNVLLSSRGQAKLVDFGLATVSGDQEDGKGRPRSIDYAGLEKVTGVSRDDSRSDIFFMGCMLYNMVTGVPPLEETRERMKRLSAQRYTQVSPITLHNSSLPHRVVILVNRLMDIDAEKRIQTPAQVLKETESVIKSVESGDVKQYDAEMSEKEAEKYLSLMSQKEEGRGKTLLLIESNIKVQDGLRERLKALGYRVLITGDPTRGLSRFEDLDPADDLPADCVIFGSAGLGMEGVAAFEKFAHDESTSNFPAILILTEPYENRVDPNWFNERHVCLTMPVKFKRVRRALRQLLNLTVPPVPISAPALEPAPNADASDHDTDVELG